VRTGRDANSSLAACFPGEAADRENRPNRAPEREDEQRHAPEQASKWLPGARFFREGAIGKNRARLSAEQEARLVERARQELEPECYDFVMQLGA